MDLNSRVVAEPKVLANDGAQSRRSFGAREVRGTGLLIAGESSVFGRYYAPGGKGRRPDRSRESPKLERIEGEGQERPRSWRMSRKGSIMEEALRWRRAKSMLAVPLGGRRGNERWRVEKNGREKVVAWRGEPRCMCMCVNVLHAAYTRYYSQTTGMGEWAWVGSGS